MSDGRDTFIHTFMNCRACVVLGKREQVEAGISSTGMVLRCKKHGLIEHFTPEHLANLIKGGPICEACAAGRPHTHN